MQPSHRRPAARKLSALVVGGRRLVDLFSTRRVFVSRQGTPMIRTAVYRTLMRYCG
jgi:hypothetical protein